MLFALAAHNNWNYIKFDIKAAFLYGELEEEVFMYLPEGYEETTEKCIFRRKDNSALLAIHVDDGIFFGKNIQDLKDLLQKLRGAFEVTFNNNPTPEDMRERIQRACTAITPEYLKNVKQSFIHRI
ncbi:hypothetical protein X777_03740 [Ooceraea biroi]|uniref:Reverse transcriptase Ty1/copia-type domain-containing protein n=1 Tax=Ooceraea biroi TaxID=2015173 RepID=A0A026X266_OOCBI|nr:hypothetical protein X777_03740 [Ooceraea biroi]